MKRMVHAMTATLAMATVTAFWTATLATELLADAKAVAAVKHGIATWGLAVLLPLMAVTGATGFALGRARGGRLVEEKRRRMPLIGGLGLVVMIPAALFLDAKAGAGEFDAVFYLVQAVELGVGALQLALMGRNFRGGLRLSGRRLPPDIDDGPAGAKWEGKPWKGR